MNTWERLQALNTDDFQCVGMFGKEVQGVPISMHVDTQDGCNIVSAYFRPMSDMDAMMWLGEYLEGEGFSVSYMEKSNNTIVGAIEIIAIIE